MSVEEKVKREILIKELATDPALAHCFIKIEDATKLYCRAYFGVACREGARPDYRWGNLPREYRTVIAKFAVETIWPQIEDQDEWLKFVEKWTNPIYKKISAGAAIMAMIVSKNTREMGKALGVSYDVAHRNIKPKLAPFEKMAKLTPLFDTRTPLELASAGHPEPRKIRAHDVLGCHTGSAGRESVDGAYGLLYEWLDFEEHPEFGIEYLRERLESQFAYVHEHHTLTGWRSVVPSPNE